MSQPISLALIKKGVAPLLHSAPVLSPFTLFQLRGGHQKEPSVKQQVKEIAVTARARTLHVTRKALAIVLISTYVIYPMTAILFFRQPEIQSLSEHHADEMLIFTNILLAALVLTSPKYIPLLFAIFIAGLIYAIDELYLCKAPTDLDLTGKVAVVTGANTGLGRATAQALAAAGAHVVFTCRSIGRCQSIVDQINQGPGTASVAVLELRSLESAFNLTRDLTERYPAIHYLFNNAGSTPIYDLTHEGLEDGFGGMHLAHMALTLGLLSSLQTGGETSDSSSRIIMVSSHMAVTSAVGVFGSEAFAPSFMIGSGEGDLRGEDTRYNGTVWSGLRAYGRAKLCNVLLAMELNRRLETKPIIAHALHPGGVLTPTSGREISGTFRGIPGLPWLVSKLFLPLMMRSVTKGAQTMLFPALATHPDWVTQGGQYEDSMCCPFSEIFKTNKQPSDAKVTLHLWNNQMLTLYKDPSVALEDADKKWSARLWDVSLGLLEESPARALVKLAP